MTTVFTWADIPHVVPDGDCWRWTAYIGSDGYGQTRVGRQTRRAHIVIFERVRGPIPKGLQLDHLCRNRWCVNPEHLEPVTQAENIRRGSAPSAIASRTGLCKRGHELAAHGYRRKSNGEIVGCRECIRERYRTDPDFAARRAADQRRYQERRRARTT